MEEDYPIIEAGTVIEWTDAWLGEGIDREVDDRVIITNMYSDEDGEIQLKIEETAFDSPPSPRTITLDDLHEQLDWREYEVR